METIKKYIYGQLAAGNLTTIEASEMLKELNQSQTRAKAADPTDRDIAIIGIAAEIGDARNPGEFWEMLRSGRDGIRPLPDARLANVEEYLRVKGLTKEDVLLREGAYLDAVDRFDPEFFKISAGEAALMDPNQRIFLEIAYQAMEDAGYGGERLAGSNTGLFVGFVHDFGDSYKHLIKDYAPGMLPMATLGNINSVIAGRLAYWLDLRGMSMLVDTACSSALVAVHLACQSIRNGDCEMALAGGIKLWVIPAEPKAGGEFGGDAGPGIGIEASDGRCHTFDDRSTGAGFGEGAAAILLKPLKKALADGDSIYAVIKGTAANQDGRSIGISAPNAAAQEAVIQKAWNDARIAPETISYIEAHGTGTRLGDPIEMYAMQNSFEKYTRNKHFCGVGSVKTNVGHLDNAAGMAGLIKVILSMQHRELPPSLHFERPNREIPFIHSPLYVNDRLTPWEVDGPRRAGVSSFGLSGTNCHIVLEEAPKEVAKPSAMRLHLFVLSAKSETSLHKMIEQYLRFLDENPALSLTDLCYTASTGRGHYSRRIAIVATDADDLRRKLTVALRMQDQMADDAEGIYRATDAHSPRAPHSSSGGSASASIRASRVEAPLRISLLESAVAIQELTRSLQELARLYISGAEIDWTNLYQGIPCRRIHLPTYEFDRKRCWVKPVQSAVPQASATEDDHYFERVWEPEELTTCSVPFGTVLLFTNSSPFCTALVNRLLAKGCHVIEVSPGEAYRRISEHRFVIASREEDYLQLLSEPAVREVKQILYLWSFARSHEISSILDMTQWEEAILFGLFHLTKALHRQMTSKVEVILIADPTYAITGHEITLRPENAALFGLGKVICQEYPDIECRCIDLETPDLSLVRDRNLSKDLHTHQEVHADPCQKVIDCLLMELQAAQPAYLVAYRAGVRYVEQFRPIASLPKGAPITLHEKGVYLITGGTGGMGLEIGKYLAQQARIHLALLGRTPLPPRENWDEQIMANPDSKEAKKLTEFQTIESLGAHVDYIPVDLGDPHAMRSVTDDLHHRYGRINGIIHAAGISGEGILQQKSDETFRNVIAPKITGTWILDNLTREDQPDFVLLFSSVSGIFGGPGQGDYTAANSYLDAYAAYLRKAGIRAMTINWTAWEETGMAFDHQVHFDQLIFKPLRTAQAITYFREVFEADCTQLLIGEIHYSRFIEVMDQLPIRLSTDLLARLDEKRQQHTRVTIPSPAPVVQVKENVGDVEKRVAAIWANILGLSTVSVDDNFYELGGDSIIALTLIKELQKEYPGTVDATDLFSRPTIRGIAEQIKAKIVTTTEVAAVQDEDEQLLSILDQLEKGDLSFEEGLEMINNLEEST